MKKKIVIIAIFIFIIGILFLGNVCKISFIKNIKDIFYEKDKMADNSEKKYTVIDVTDLEDEGSVEHDHTFKTMYDENMHWKECTICGEKSGEIKHSYTDIWYDNTLPKCYYSNYCTKTCTCGYSYIYREPCVWDGKYVTWAGCYSHVRGCSKCKGTIFYDYWYDGTLYEKESNISCRYKNDGSIASCQNPSGVCKICNYSYGANIKYHNANFNNETNEMYCTVCNMKLCKITNEIVEKKSDAPSTYEIIDDIVLENGTTFQKGALVGNWDALKNWYEICEQKVTEMNSDKTKFKLTTTIKFKKEIKYSVYHSIRINVILDGAVFDMNLKTFKFFPETVKPIINNITMGNGSEELTEWSRTKPIIIAGTENYCDIVNVKILDDKENVVFDGNANVSGNNYSISCIPELECDTNGRKFKAIVTDTCENRTEQIFTIAKVDAISPTATSSDDITGEWSKSRKFKFTATDYGIGEVKIAFNDIEDLSLANYDGIEYSRDYEFYGDVYTPKQLSVLYRDGLGNTSMQKITIDKLDNTAPTIESASIHNNIVTVNAHDRHESLGEGSGIVKYRYIASSEKLSNPDVSSGIEVNVGEKIVIDDVYKVKYIYMVAEDYVGNVSDVYELKVPELILTSSVDLSLANGKGGVVLDWSTYDVIDKYFVIYRKEDNSSSWETIVSLDEKLTESTYTDIFGNDKAKPNVPNINITGDVLNNNIKVDVTSADNGTRYMYYIEAYDDGGTLVQTSN